MAFAKMEIIAARSMWTQNVKKMTVILKTANNVIHGYAIFTISMAGVSLWNIVVNGCFAFKYRLD